jgi:hypothetical protein
MPIGKLLTSIIQYVMAIGIYWLFQLERTVEFSDYLYMAFIVIVCWQTRVSFR